MWVCAFRHLGAVTARRVARTALAAAAPLLDVGVRRWQPKRPLRLDGRDPGHGAQRRPARVVDGAGDHPDGAQYLLDLHPGGLQPGDDLVDPPEVVVVDRHGDLLGHVCTSAHGARTSPAPTSSEGSGSRRAERTSWAHSDSPVASVRCDHSAAIPATCGVDMLVPEIVL